MIKIEQHQKLPESDNLFVLSPSGDYEDSAFIDYYDISQPDIAAGRFQAQYIKYGGIIYRFNDPTSLGEELLKIDPKSTHDAASFVRINKELLAKMNGGELNSNSLSEAITNEQTFVDDQLTNPDQNVNATSTPVTTDSPNLNLSTEATTTDQSIIDNQTSSTTPSSTIDLEPATTTQDVLLNETPPNETITATTTEPAPEPIIEETASSTQI